MNTNRWCGVLAAFVMTWGAIGPCAAIGQAAVLVAQAGILESLPPDVLDKVRALAGLLQQSINKGELTDAQIQHELQDGQLEQTIRGLGPDADRLMQEITSGLKSGQGESALSGLLQGLTLPAP